MSKRAKPDKQSARHDSGPAADDLDLARATDLVMQMMAIPGRSCEEGEVVEFIRSQLRQAGASEHWMRIDNAHQKSPFGGQVGNLILKLPGNRRAPRRLLLAHVDTVPICVGSRPVRKGRFVQSADAATGLGADDRAGAAVVLATALEMIESRRPHPPLTFMWTVQEEIGLYGARHAQLGLLGKPRLAFNFDGGAPTKLTVGATGGYRMTINIRGVASHAGGAPEQGVSAIAIAARAIADLHDNGWHGAIEKGKQRGTSNVGVIQGGSATNVVTDHVVIKAEARSHSPTFRKRIVRQIESAFERAAQSTRNILGQCGQVECDGRLDYESFRLPAREPCVLAAEEAVRSIGGQPLRFVSDGGVDANLLTARGIPTVTLGCGQLFQHTCREQLDVTAFQDACRIAFRLASDSVAP